MLWPLPNGLCHHICGKWHPWLAAMTASMALLTKAITSLGRLVALTLCSMYMLAYLITLCYAAERLLVGNKGIINTACFDGFGQGTCFILHQQCLLDFRVLITKGNLLHHSLIVVVEHAQVHLICQEADIIVTALFRALPHVLKCALL